MPVPENLSAQPSQPPKSRATGVMAHLLVIAYGLSGVVIQLFVPRFSGVFDDLGAMGVQKPDFAMAMLLRFQGLCLLAAIAFPSLAVLVAWRTRFRAPLPRVCFVLLVLISLLGGATTFALVRPLSDVVQAADAIGSESGRP